MPSEALPAVADRQRITLAILALGGQGGGVLADWILDLANANGYVAQGTSVPGVAQRTGATVYYIEMIPRLPGDNREPPVLALNPVPGDVDIVIASELMETGRAILRGFVSGDRTTLIGSTHRVYAVSEKSAMGSGVGSSERIIEAAERRAARFIGFDMDATAAQAGCVISAVMFGALAGSDALPFTREAFEQSIRHGGKAIASNLAGFEAGAQHGATLADVLRAQSAPRVPTTEAGRALLARIETTLPEAAHANAIEGAAQLLDYQDRGYADLYLDRLARVFAADPGSDDHALTREAARHLALWMAYEDTIRVADLKIRGARFDRIQSEAHVGEGQLWAVTEYMHPRLQEVCEAMPARLGAWILHSPGMRRWLEPWFTKGRHVRTSGIRWFLMLRFLAALRPMRKGTLRYREEQERIGHWLDLAIDEAARDAALATGIVRSQRLIKGYSDTLERGLRNHHAVVGALPLIRQQPDPAAAMRKLIEAALSDENGEVLREALAALEPMRDGLQISPAA